MQFFWEEAHNTCIWANSPNSVSFSIQNSRKWNYFLIWNRCFYHTFIIKSSLQYYHHIWSIKHKCLYTVLRKSAPPGGLSCAESTGQCRDSGSTPGRGRSPGEEKGNPPSPFAWGNSTDRGARWATVRGVDTTERLNSSTAGQVSDSALNF